MPLWFKSFIENVVYFCPFFFYKLNGDFILLLELKNKKVQVNMQLNKEFGSMIQTTLVVWSRSPFVLFMGSLAAI